MSGERAHEDSDGQGVGHICIRLASPKLQAFKLGADVRERTHDYYDYYDYDE